MRRERGSDRLLEPALDLESLEGQPSSLGRESARRGRDPLPLLQRALERREPVARRARTLGEIVPLGRGTPRLGGRLVRTGLRARPATRGLRGRARGRPRAAAQRRGRARPPARAAPSAARAPRRARRARGSRSPSRRSAHRGHGRPTRALRGRRRAAVPPPLRPPARRRRAAPGRVGPALRSSRSRSRRHAPRPPPREMHPRARGQPRRSGSPARAPRPRGPRRAALRARRATRSGRTGAPPHPAAGRARRARPRARRRHPRARPPPPRAPRGPPTAAPASSGARARLRFAARRPPPCAPRAPRGRATRRARASVAISPASFSARSAAVAWRARGRSRLRTSSSTSRARSTWVATRASFSSARWRRRLNFPSPAASSTSARRSSGLDASTASTFPCETIECIVPPSPTSASSSTRSVRRTGVRLTRYWPSPPADEPPRDRHLAEVELLAEAAVLVVEHELDLAVVGGGPGRRAAEEDVVGPVGTKLGRRERARRPHDRVGHVRLAGPVRTDDDGDPGLEGHLDGVGERLEAAQLDGAQVHRAGSIAAAADGDQRSFAVEMAGRRDRASGVRQSSTWASGSVASACAAASCSAAFFVEPRPYPERLAVDQGGADEPALVRRPFDREHLVLDDAAGPRERLLQLGLRVDVPRACELDPLCERLDDRLLDLLEAVLEVHRRDRRLEQRGENVAAERDAVQLRPGDVLRPLDEHAAEVEVARDASRSCGARRRGRGSSRGAPRRRRGTGRTAHGRSRARARSRRGTRDARTTTRGRAPRRCA